MQPAFYEGNEYYPGGSPILGYDLNGVAYIGGYYAPDDSGGSNLVFEGFQKSNDGVNWSAPAAAVGRPDYEPIECWMSVDTNASSPYVNSVYVSCVMIGPMEKLNRNQVVVSHSNNGGATWRQVDVAAVQVYPPEDRYTNMNVGRDGSVYVTWMYCYSYPYECNDETKGYIVFSKSSDGGNTWTKPKLVTTVALHGIPNTQTGVPDGPVIAVDNSDGTHSGNLYIAMYKWTGSFMQVVVARSADGGTTWSKPVPVSPGVTHDQFLPWISVGSTGLVGVSWLDRRNDPNNIDYQAYAGISSDGGLTFENVQLTTAFSNPNQGTEDQGIGDYTGNTWDGPDYFVAAWLDNSQSFYDEDFVGGIRLK